MCASPDHPKPTKTVFNPKDPFGGRRSWKAACSHRLRISGNMQSRRQLAASDTHFIYIRHSLINNLEKYTSSACTSPGRTHHGGRIADLGRHREQSELGNYPLTASGTSFQADASWPWLQSTHTCNHASGNYGPCSTRPWHLRHLPSRSGPLMGFEDYSAFTECQQKSH